MDVIIIEFTFFADTTLYLITRIQPFLVSTHLKGCYSGIHKPCNKPSRHNFRDIKQFCISS